MLTPVTPRSWYLIGRSKDFKVGKIKKITIHQTDFVITRKTTGKVVAWANRCPHMGADLSRGHVHQDELVCPFHAWRFNDKGECTHIPADPESLGCSRKLKTYPIVEKFGLVFVNNSRKPNFDLPFFDDLREKMLIAGRPFQIHQDAAWYVVSANAFDVAHFVHVHNRIPLREPEVQDLGDYGKRIKHFYKIKPSNVIADKIIGFFFGREGTLEYTVFGSNYILAKSTFGRFSNHMVIVLQPSGENKSISTIALVKDVSDANIFQIAFRKLVLKFQTYFTKKFFKAEADEILGVRVNKKSLHKSDSILKEYLEYVDKVLGLQGAQQL